MSSASSSDRPKRQPIRYQFVSIDEECYTDDNNNTTSQQKQYKVADDDDNDPSCFHLLEQFYNELMITTFPLEDQRDDIEDWYECFRMQSKLHRHRIHLQHMSDVKDALTCALNEEGIASRVQHFAYCDEEIENDDCEFDGPAMDVIIMVLQAKDDALDASKMKEVHTERSLLSSRCQSCTTSENEVVTNDDIDNNNQNTTSSKSIHQFIPRRKSSLLQRRQSSLYGGLYTPTDNDDDDDSDEGEDMFHDLDQKEYTIIGGAAVEYYKQARVGLLSYIVLHSQYRGCGLAKVLHNEALSRLEMLAEYYELSSQTEIRDSNKQRPLQAIFAETNTPAAGDVSPEQSLVRHTSLFNLGYRLVNFPYAQPPLSTEDSNASFDDIVLLVYFPFHMEELHRRHAEGRTDEELQKYFPWFIIGNDDDDERNDDHDNTVQMNANIPFQYVEDFYQCVFGYHHDREHHDEDGGIPDHHKAAYYRLAHWFTHSRQSCSKGGVEVSLSWPNTPWEDCKGRLLNEYEEWKVTNEHSSHEVLDDI